MWKKITFFSAIFSVLLMLPILVGAQSVFEEDQSGASRTSLELEGGYTHDFAIESDGTVWIALNSPNGLFNSTDGSTWSSLPSGSDFGNMADVEVSSSSVFAIGGIALYRSQDGGSNWTELTGLVNVGSTMHYGQGKLFVDMRDYNLAISDDEGDTFTTVTVNNSVTAINSIATSSTAVYLLGTTGSNTDTLFKSTDGGSTWTSTGKTITGGDNEVVVKPTNDNFIILKGTEIEYTTDGGTNWNTLTSNYNADVEFSGDRIYIGKYFTDDNGTNWTEIVESSGVSQIRSDAEVAIDPTNSNIIYVETMVGVARTTDGGTTTADMNSGLQGVTINDIAQSSDKDTVCLAATGGLAITTNFTDSTPTWSFPVVGLSTVSSASACWVNPDDATNIVSDQGILFYSTDTGTSWSEATGDTPGNTGDFLEVDGSLYAGHDDGVAVSTDDGVTWSDTGLGDVPVNALAADSNNIYAAVGEEDDSTSANRGIYIYNGSAWTQVSASGVDDLLFNDVIVADDTVFACSGATEAGSVVKSTDQGSTWTDLTGNGLAADGWYHALAYETSDSDVLYVSTARPAGTGYIYKTMDGGDNWVLYYTGLVDETFNAMLFDGLVLGTNTGVYSMTSKAKVKIQRNKKRVKKNHKVKLTGTLKDKTTKEILPRKRVKLYKKHKLSKKWKKIKTKKTNNKGKVLFKRKIKKKTFFRMTFKAKSSSAAAESFGTSVYKSKRVKVRLKKK